MTLFMLGLLVLAALIGAGAHWLFRRRDPDEIAAARKKLERFRKHR